MVASNSAEFGRAPLVPLSFGDHRCHLRHQYGCRTDAKTLLGDGEEPVDVNRHAGAVILKRLDGGQHDRHAGLVVEMARDDEAVVEEFRLRIDGDEVADIDAERIGLLARQRGCIDPVFDMGPADGLSVDLVIEVWPEALRRQDRTRG